MAEINSCLNLINLSITFLFSLLLFIIYSKTFSKKKLKLNYNEKHARVVG
jgi:hypothetical protein